MKTKKILTLVCAAVICVTQFSCKKDKVDITPEPTKLYLPTTILEQNTSTAATIYTIGFVYNTDASVSTISQVGSARSVNWSFNYNANGTLNTASRIESGSVSQTTIYTLSYDVNNKLSKILASGTNIDTLNLSYNAATMTYVGNGGLNDGISIKLNAAGQMEGIQKLFGIFNVNLVYQSSQKGIFADVKMNESVHVFLNIYNAYQTSYSFFHGHEVSGATYGTTSYTYQNYNRDANGNISTFQSTNSTSSIPPNSYTVSYKEQ